MLVLSIADRARLMQLCADKAVIAVEGYVELANMAMEVGRDPTPLQEVAARELTRLSESSYAPDMIEVEASPRYAEVLAKTGWKEQGSA
jgi:hypothetical protein